MKKLSILMVLVLVVSAVLCSCGKNEKAYDYDLKEYITLGEFPKTTFDEKDLTEALDAAVEEIATNYKTTAEITDRPVAEGDVVNIDYVGKMDGKEFEGGSAKGSDLKIGSDSFIPGFEDGLIGKNLNDEVVLNLVFPEDYRSEEHAGKDVEFTVKINKITSETIPALTDKMVSEKTEYETVEEFLAAQKLDLAKSLLWDEYLSSCKVNKYPPKETKLYYDRMIEQYSSMAVYYGMTLESFVTSYYGYKSVDEFLNYAMDAAMLSVKEEMVIYLTIDEYDVEFSDSDYSKKGMEFATEAGYGKLDDYEKAVGKENVELQIYFEMLLDDLCEANGIENVKYELPAETTTETGTETGNAAAETGTPETKA